VTRNLTARLAAWIGACPSRQIGQILIRRLPSGFDLRHHEDDGRTDLETFSAPEEARFLALFDGAGAYRPLKTAPNLRRGWRLALGDPGALRIALDFLYPAMLGVLLDWERGLLPPVSLRATLGRQSGMYAITRKLTDEEAQAMIGGFCASRGGCLKTILWRIAPDVPITSLPPEKFASGASAAPCAPLPMLCHEACNLLVAKAREVVKGKTRPE
jgi:sirohydrochlorin cobaltochelatase